MNAPAAFSVADLQEALRRAKSGSRHFATNFFVPSAQWPRWIERGLRPVQTGNSFLLLEWPEEKCTRLFFAGDRAAIANVLSRPAPAPSQILAVDLIGRPVDVMPIADGFAAAGFRPHLKLSRLSRFGAQGATTSESAPDCPLAETEDIPAILKLLNEDFDVYADALPSAAAVQDAIAAGEIRAIRHERKLDGFVWYTKTGATALIRYWYVSPDSRGKGVGSRLMRDYFVRTGECARHLLWVRENNTIAAACYAHYGYKQDGLEDQVMVLGN